MINDARPCQVALHVAIECNPESRAEIIRALSAHRARCLKDEPGTIQFEVMVPFESPSKLFLFELYTDDAALSAHRQGASMVRYLEEVKGKILNTEIHRCSLGNE
jgi:(4S)-4-hydroxy-5-phosphonooxypentane-2,3-dione isomerase